MVLQGTIVGLQIQSSSLKRGELPNRRYDPAPLVSVSTLMVSQDGVCGLVASGDRFVDVHNRTHPHSKNRNGTNGISIDFTSHYRAMRDRFGPHLVNGLAGENILVELDEMVLPEGLSGEMVIHESATEEIRLSNVVVAEPCVEFARFALSYPDEAKPDRRITEALRFLGQGMRGYYAASTGLEARITTGSRITIV